MQAWRLLAGQPIVFPLSSRREVAAAKPFFAEAIGSQGLAPKTITLNGQAASHRASAFRQFGEVASRIGDMSAHQ
jgi:transposase-like protein